MVLEQSKKKKFHENMCVVCEKMSAEKFHEKMCVVRENMCAMEIHEKMCVVVTVIGKKNRNKGLRDGGHRQKMRPKCILRPPPPKPPNEQLREDERRQIPRQNERERIPREDVRGLDGNRVSKTLRLSRVRWRTPAENEAEAIPPKPPEPMNERLFGPCPVLPGFMANDATPEAPAEWTNPSEKAKDEFQAESLMHPVDLARRVLPEKLFEVLQTHATAGVSTECGPPWPTAVIDQAMKTGPHTSATTEENVALIWDDIQYQERLGFVRIMTEAQLRAELPANLKVSRVAIVPQANRRGRIILNLSADVEMPEYRPNGKRRKVTPKHPSVNETTTPAADHSGAEALGSARPAIL